MKRTALIFAGPLAALTLASTAAHGSTFDGQRRGFMIGLELAAHDTSADLSASAGALSIDGEEDASGAALGFRIGGGLSERATLYFVRNTSFDDGDVWGLTGIGGTYYLQPTGPSVYLHWGVGLGDVSPDDDDMDTATGRAGLVGVGYAPAPGVHVGLSAMNVRATDDSTFDGIDVDYDITTLQLGAGYTWF